MNWCNCQNHHAVSLASNPSNYPSSVLDEEHTKKWSIKYEKMTWVNIGLGKGM